MERPPLPEHLANRVVDHEEALKIVVQSGRRLGSGFATSEPHRFYDTIWEHIQKQDIHDLCIRQALFMAPHKLCVGSALESRGLMHGPAKRRGHSLLSALAKRINGLTRKTEGLRRLIDHYRELQERRITFVCPFIGAATNLIIPDNALTRLLYPDFVGRNTTRMGITDMQSIHFPDAVDSLCFDMDGKPLVDTFVCVMTPPDERGMMSHGPACGANSEIVEKILQRCDIDLLLYLNPNYPFTEGYGDAPNTIHKDQFRELSQARRLYVVWDDSRIPAVPASGMNNASGVDIKIAHHVVNHIEMNRAYTYGRAIQVGIGGTGVLAVKELGRSSWRGRSYTEMLEPYTLDLFEAGKFDGSHFIERDGRRTQLDGKVVCTFTIGEEGSDFYKRLHRNPALVIAPASRVVIPEGFYHGLGINNCLAIDFHGHVNAAGRWHNHHSGIGGAAQICRGLARGGVSYLCLKSTHRDLEGIVRSSIMPFLPAGTPISLVGPDLVGGRDGARTFLVTEHGVARLSGQTQSQLIKGLINVAHPDFREELRRAAWDEFRVSA